MAAFGPEAAAEIVSASKNSLGEVQQALERTFDLESPQVDVGAPATLDWEALPEGFDGPGLVLSLLVEDVAAVIAVPESCGLLPDWYARPDATGISRLTTLAQELGMLLLPEQFMPLDFTAAPVPNVAEVLKLGGVEAGAGLVDVSLACGEKAGRLSLIWPAPNPDELLQLKPPPPLAPPPKPNPQGQPQPADFPEFTPSREEHPNIRYVSQLPVYSRSLLRIKVPVSVTLASDKQPLKQIIELGPGAILQFDKSCDEMLELEIAGHKIALGEAVKVGDKFGLRIASLVMPGERFAPVNPR